MFRTISAIMIAAAGALGLSPAFATAFTFNFTNNNATIAQPTATSNGNYLLFSLVNGATQVASSGACNTATAAACVTATAWNANLSNGSYTITQSTLGQYVGGLGVSSGSATDNLNGCGTEQCGAHQIDNIGNSNTSSSIDFVQLVFDKAVILTGLGRSAFGIGPDGSKVFDDDASYGSGTALLNQSTQTMTSNSFTSMLSKSLLSVNSTPGATTCSVSNAYGTDYCYDEASIASAGAASKVWFVSASILSNFGGDGNPDGFKLADLSVVTAPVPEPASWTMIILGFGAVGGVIRRQRRADAAARSAA